MVRHIYQLIIEGNGPMQVARILKDEKVERPSYYLAKQGLGTCRGNVLGGVPIGDVEKSVNRWDKRQKKKNYLRQSARLSQK